MRRRLGSEQGAVVVVVALSMVLLLGIAALVLDLSSLRADRALSRTVTDQAATAGVLELWAGDGQAACDAALEYLELNLNDGSFTGASCGGLPASCNPGTAAVSTAGTSGRWTATITYPVPDTHPLMDPATIGSTTQALHDEDGDQCQRLGVQLDGTRNYYFAQVIGAASGDTDVHAVARGTPSDSADLVLNLLILERYDCDALSASGSGGGVGGIVTDAVWNPVDMVWDPGWTAVDSDSSSGVGCSANGVIDLDGLNTVIRADGPAGCPTELPGGDPGDGCGEIRVLAPGTPGCNWPACTSSSALHPAPPPEYLPQRVTRAPVDHRYNCKGSYNFGVGWEINPCTDAPTRYIDNLVTDYGGSGPPTGFATYAGPCPTIPVGTTVTLSGDTYIDCLDGRLNVNGELIITGGDVVSEHRVNVNGTLSFNVPGPPGGPFLPRVFYLRDGELGKTGSGNLYLHQTTVYMSATADLDLGGGSGELMWTAPDDVTGAYKFDDLALWSEGTSEHTFAGQALLDLEGVFFVPWGTVAYKGGSVQHQVSAQFISRKLKSTGQGLLIVAPDYDRAVLFPELLDVQLIR